MLFRQLFDTETCTYTYLLADEKERKGILIDPVLEKVNRDLSLIEELGVELQYVLDTHVHADHITGANGIREATGAKIAMGNLTGVENADRLLKDGEEISFGRIKMKAVLTPGHTDGCTSYVVNGSVFTGDALFIRGCGRTDFQHGCCETLYESVHKKLFSLPDETLVFPGHDYNGQTVSTVGEEKKYNPRLKLSNSKEAFVSIMKSLKLSKPKKIQIAVPANLKCGVV